MNYRYAAGPRADLARLVAPAALAMLRDPDAADGMTVREIANHLADACRWVLESEPRVERVEGQPLRYRLREAGCGCAGGYER